MQLNLNDFVSFTLTQSGAEIMNQHEVQFPQKYRQTNKSEGDLVQLPLWEVIQIFGSHMYIGNPKCPFFTNNSINI